MIKEKCSWVVGRTRETVDENGDDGWEGLMGKRIKQTLYTFYKFS